MNKLLAETLNILNGLTAVVIVIGGSIGMGKPWNEAAPSLGAYVVGAVIGAIVASVVCGIIAYISLIERHLATIAEATSESAENLAYLSKCAHFQSKVAEIQLAAYEPAPAVAKRTTG